MRKWEKECDDADFKIEDSGSIETEVKRKTHFDGDQVI